ncbi:MAG: histidine kinase dimerization/phospho-acceptor domain-containing protein [Acidobacteriota bacterium]
MSTDLSDVLSVLAHELRSPLSVLQGYIRLLQRKRDAADPESAMLTAMLTATSRLATLGRQSSDLAVWARRDEPGTTTDVAAFTHAIASHAPAGATLAPVPDDMTHRAFHVADVQALAQSIGALAELAMRETRQSAAAIAVRPDDDGALRVVIAVTPDAATLEAGGTLPATTEPVPFNRGGLGLSLCLASYVLATHEATATATSDLAHIDVRIGRGRARP